MQIFMHACIDMYHVCRYVNMQYNLCRCLPDNKRGGGYRTVVFWSYCAVIHWLWLCLCNCVSVRTLLKYFLLSSCIVYNFHLYILNTVHSNISPCIVYISLLYISFVHCTVHSIISPCIVYISLLYISNTVHSNISPCIVYISHFYISNTVHSNVSPESTMYSCVTNNFKIVCTFKYIYNIVLRIEWGIQFTVPV